MEPSQEFQLQKMVVFIRNRGHISTMLNLVYLLSDMESDDYLIEI